MDAQSGFIYPDLLWLLLLLIPLVVLWNFVSRRRNKVLARFADPKVWSFINPFVSMRGRFHKAALFLIAIAFSIVAAARPYWGVKERELEVKGVDIIFAFDVSDSMLARDIEPSRLAHARMKFREILAGMPGQRIGIIPFAGDSFLQCPMTTDYSILINTLEGLNTNTIGTPGTNIASAIQTAVESFERTGTNASKAIVLLTDGEDHSGEAVSEARKAAEAGIRIYSLGIGSTTGAPIVEPDGTFKETPTGQKVLSRLDVKTLRTISEITRGSSYIAEPGQRLDVRPLIGDLQDLEQGEFGVERRIVRQERYQWPLALALLCLMMETLVGEKRTDGGARRKKITDSSRKEQRHESPTSREGRNIPGRPVKETKTT